MKIASSAAAPARPIEHGRRQRASRLQLTVQHATRSRTIPSDARFRKWIRAALRDDARVTVRVVGLEESRTLNRTYRGKNRPTNVLTFVMRESPPYEGDLALCAPLVAREARAQGKDIAAHYAHLTVHGVLHLQGYDHARGDEAAVMENLEKRILERLGYPDPYAAEHGRRSE